MNKVSSIPAHTPQQNSAENHHRKGELTLLTALASGASIKEAARLSGVGERTAHRRLEDSAFQERIRNLRSEYLSAAVGKLSETTIEAANTLRELLNSQSDSVRLSAARAILEFAPKLRESVELEKRMAHIEAEVFKKR
ncbi:MAG: hypothetical protein M3362_27480 [Acidobacteriota bacterium]|nr:hypothetical protein [Acidobacteriota bacterium]